MLCFIRAWTPFPAHIELGMLPLFLFCLSSRKNNRGPCCVFPGSWLLESKGKFVSGREGGHEDPSPSRAEQQIIFTNSPLGFYFPKEQGPAWKFGIEMSCFLIGQQIQGKRAEIQRVLQVLKQKENQTLCSGQERRKAGETPKHLLFTPFSLLSCSSLALRTTSREM